MSQVEPLRAARWPPQTAVAPIRIRRTRRSRRYRGSCLSCAMASRQVQLLLVAASSPGVLFSTRHALAPGSHRFASSGAASRLVSSFTRGSPSVFWISSMGKKARHQRTSSPTVRCEQGTKQSNGLDVWLGRLAMVGFAIAITIEISTGKGLLENLGFTAPLPTVALAVTALVGALTAFFIFQSASRE